MILTDNVQVGDFVALFQGQGDVIERLHPCASPVAERGLILAKACLGPTERRKYIKANTYSHSARRWTERGARRLPPKVAVLSREEAADVMTNPKGFAGLPELRQRIISAYAELYDPQPRKG